MTLQTVSTQCFSFLQNDFYSRFYTEDSTEKHLQINTYSKDSTDVRR